MSSKIPDMKIEEHIWATYLLQSSIYTWDMIKHKYSKKFGYGVSVPMGTQKPQNVTDAPNLYPNDILASFDFWIGPEIGKGYRMQRKKNFFFFFVILFRKHRSVWVT